MPYLLHLVSAEPIEANSITSKTENFASFANCTDAIYRVLRSSIFVDSGCRDTPRVSESHVFVAFAGVRANNYSPLRAPCNTKKGRTHNRFALFRIVDAINRVRTVVAVRQGGMPPCFYCFTTLAIALPTRTMYMPLG